MAKFFSSSLSNYLTAASGHFIDWSRVGELIASGTHRYSTYELIQRGAILASMSFGAYLGYTFGGDSLYSMAGCFAAFVISHALIIAPLVYKRMRVREECRVIEHDILNLLQQIQAKAPQNPAMPDLIKQISDRVKTISEINLSDDKHARASGTWGRRRSLLEQIKMKLELDLQLISVCGDSELIIKDLHHFWSQDLSNGLPSLNALNALQSLQIRR